MKKVLSIVLSLVMVLCMVPTMAFADTAVYSDIEGTACEASVELLNELGVVDGYEDGTYQPEGIVTRAEMAKLIVTQLGLNPTSSTTDFTDMDAAKWAIPYVGYAESLNIIKGYGDGRFGPNDTVTYDQAVTMIVRAIGYTEACNEMQGNWPAVFVQKANELGVLKNIATTGDGGANRGDVAIMLANALYVPMVYADGEGVTQFRNNGEVDPITGELVYMTMYNGLVKEGGKGYGIVLPSDLIGSAKNINELLGAAAQIVTDEDGDVISVSDIKSTFMTGKFNDAGTVFTSDDTDYMLDEVPFAYITSDKGQIKEDGIAYAFKNGGWAPDSFVASTTEGAINTAFGTTDNPTLTIACIVKGNTITDIFSIQLWSKTIGDQIDDSQIAQIEKNSKLLGKEFAKDIDGNIDTDRFILAGVDSLDEIADDNIVYVYVNPDTNKISKVEVGTEVVSGEIERIVINETDPATGDATDADDDPLDYKDSYIYIDGTKYQFANDDADDNDSVLKAANDVTLYLDYSGKIYASELTSGTTGNYAIIVDATPWKGTGIDAGATKLQLMTGEGLKTFVVNASKVEQAQYETDVVTVSGTTVTPKYNNIIKYSLNDAGEIKEIVDVVDSAVGTSGKITAKGYLDSQLIADGAVIVAAPTNGTPATSFMIKTDTGYDTDDLAVVAKETILNSDVAVYKYFVNSKGTIEFLMVDNAIVSDDIYGVVSAAWNTSKDMGADYYVGTEFFENAEVDGTVTAGAILYKIVENADGSVKFVDQTGNDTAKIVASAGSTIAADIEAGILSGSVAVSNDKVTIGSTTANLADDVVVYIWSDGKFDVYGSTSDIIDEKNTSIEIFRTANLSGDDDNPNYGLVDVVIIKR